MTRNLATLASRIILGGAVALAAGCSTAEEAPREKGGTEGEGGPGDSGLPATDAGCSVVVPAACGDAIPSYAADIVPVFEAKCNGCHVEGEGKPWPLTNYDDVFHWRSVVIDELKTCSMPPGPPNDGGTTLSHSEVEMILAWLVCEAPDN